MSLFKIAFPLNTNLSVLIVLTSNACVGRDIWAPGLTPTRLRVSIPSTLVMVRSDSCDCPPLNTQERRFSCWSDSWQLFCSSCRWRRLSGGIARRASWTPIFLFKFSILNILCLHVCLIVSNKSQTGRTLKAINFGLFKFKKNSGRKRWNLSI